MPRRRHEVKGAVCEKGRIARKGHCTKRGNRAGGKGLGSTKIHNMVSANCTIINNDVWKTIIRIIIRKKVDTSVLHIGSRSNYNERHQTDPKPIMRRRSIFSPSCAYIRMSFGIKQGDGGGTKKNRTLRLVNHERIK